MTDAATLKNHTEPDEMPSASTLEESHRKTHCFRNTTIILIVIILVVLVTGRIMLPFWIKDYVNETLNSIPGYSGSVEDIDLSLYRGAYVIDGLKLFKKEKNIPVPFLDIQKTDLSLQWSALIRGKIVGDVTLTNPVINFAVGKTGAVQTGTDTDWTKPIKELMPLDINWVEIKGGHVAYRNFSTRPNVDIFIKDLNAKATNLRNIEDKNNTLPSTVTARGISIGNGKLSVDGKVNILKKVPDIDLKGKLEEVSLPAMNNYARAFAGIDFSKGTLNAYSDLNIKNGQVSGFVKPLATNIELISDGDFAADPIGVIWESIVSVVLEVFENQPKDQFGTQIDLQGTIDNPETNFWSTLGGIFRNAFVKAYSRTFDSE